MACEKPHGNPAAIFAAADAIDRYACSTEVRMGEAVSPAQVGRWTGAVADQVSAVAAELDSYLGGYSSQLHEYASQLRAYATELQQSQSCSLSEILTWVFFAVFVVVEIVIGFFSGGILSGMLMSAFSGLMDSISTLTAGIGTAVLDTIEIIAETGGSVGRTVANIARAVPEVASRFAGQAGRFLVNRVEDVGRDVTEDFITKAVSTIGRGPGALAAQYGLVDGLGFASNLLPLGEAASAIKHGASSLFSRAGRLGAGLELPAARLSAGPQLIPTSPRVATGLDSLPVTVRDGMAPGTAPGTALGGSEPPVVPVPVVHAPQPEVPPVVPVPVVHAPQPEVPPVVPAPVGQAPVVQVGLDDDLSRAFAPSPVVQPEAPAPGISPLHRPETPMPHAEPSGEPVLSSAPPPVPPVGSPGLMSPGLPDPQA
ncbi:hypothetical protein LLS1_24250 [Leifsonia sp. LS1]|uniref:hypothetical protein n=1 Tax=Leifsonia sp. LS1 TaxID=2828483 RepID=UPI001CFF53C1|nr:hypothetical protein [Leifsonia sp. LS1]GIT80756.1 hypothetical protein LLS1_24250 [Leifsonia sp. LS1]